MKIGIYTGLFEGYGIGNLVRQLELARYLMNNNKNEIIFFSNDPKRAKKLSEKIGESTEFCGEISNNLDVLLIDTPFHNQIFGDIKKIRFDYFDYNNDDTDIIINLYNQRISELNNPLNFKGKLYQGLKYFILRDIYLTPLSFPNASKNKKILIVFGGDDPMNHTQKVLSYLKLSHLIKVVEVTIMVPPNKNEYDVFVDNHDFKIELERNSRNILKWMTWSDIVFCGGGGLLIESLFMKKTVFAIPQNDLESNFINYVGSVARLFRLEEIENIVNEPYLNRNNIDELVLHGKKNILEIIGNV
jgi:spore coat polysaccharide biosynthesis predicted glycosyltransferase SpsG